MEEEILILILEEITEDDIIAEGAIVFSEDLITDLGVDSQQIEEVYEDIVSSQDTFKDWMKNTFKLSAKIVNSLIGLQMIYNMIFTHYKKVNKSRKHISLGQALDDIEVTLKLNYSSLIKLAQKEENSPDFSTLPADIKLKIESIKTQTPMAYWKNVEDDIIETLKKIPLYN